MKKYEYEVLNLHCANCASKIQDRANSLVYIKHATINLYKKKFIIETLDNFNEMDFLDSINKFADSIEPGTKIIPLNEEEVAKRVEENLKKEEAEERKEKISIISGLILFLLSIIAGYFYPFVKIYISIIAYIILGRDVVIKSFKNMQKGNFMDENFLMTIATFGAFYLNETTEAVGVMLFYKIGEYFQDKAVSNSRKSIKKLLDIRPEYANIKDNNGQIIKVSPKTLKIGDIIIVKAGEKIPVDGVVTKGNTTLNTAALTGESLPVDVEVNSNVLSGSINGNNTIEIKVTKLFSDSTVNKIIEMVENAGNKKAKAEKFITKFARYYTPIVVILAVLVGIIIPLIFGDFDKWFSRALIFLVISCPCALVLSVPLTFFSSIGQASKNGILIKGGNYLESLTSVGAVVFDKTGTLTKGKFVIDKIEPTNCSKKELINISHIGEFYSTHPIGKAILNTGENEVNENLINGYQEISGLGVISYYDSDEILVGNYKLMEKYGIKAQEKSYAGTIIYIAKNSEFLGYIYISDQVKIDSKSTISFLKNMHIVSYMLTGDNHIIGNDVGDRLGISKNNVFCNLLPQDKVQKIEEIKKKTDKNVVFVGDGINDAPVLSLADIGIAMGGSGSDIAVEAADIVIMKDEPSKVLELLKIAKINKKVVLQNIFFALAIKIIVMVLGVLGIANMWLAIFADVGVSVLAVLNSSWGVKKHFK